MNDIKLRFGANGSFRILMVSDFHAGPDYNPKLKTGLEALVKDCSPDLVVVGGDQCLERDGFDAVRDYMADIMEPVIKREIPWFAVFGNHDHEMGLCLEEEEKVYESLPFCLSQRGPEDITGIGNFCLPVYSRDGEKIRYNLWALCSNSTVNDYIEMFGLKKDTQFIFENHFNDGENGSAPLFDQIQWYFNKSVETEKAENYKVPGLMFMHIPVPEFLQLSRNPEQCNTIGSKRATFGCTELNTGLFTAALQRGDIKGFFFGHEHHCDMQGEYAGITLACDAALGYNMSAHDDLRGGRVIDIFENGDMQTRQIRLMDLLGKAAMRDPDYFEGGCRYHIRIL